MTDQKHYQTASEVFKGGAIRTGSFLAGAVGCNKITEQQIAKVDRFAKSLAGGKVSLLFDADEAGDEGAKEAHWLVAQRGLDVRLAWSRGMHGGQFAGRQPESLTAEELGQVIRHALTGRPAIDAVA